MRHSFRSTNRRPGIVLLLLSLTLPAARLHAQDEARLPLRGTVVDARSGAPLESATVELEGRFRSAATRPDGGFTFRRLDPGGYMLVVHQLGYRDQRRYVTLADSAAPVRIALQPEPVMLEALRVTYSRFEQRRRSVPYAVRVIDRRELAHSGGSSALQVVQRRVSLNPTTCRLLPNNKPSPLSPCSMVRGSRVVVGVWIDEKPAPGGLMDLETYSPSELHSVEIYAGGKMIRAYTVGYMELAARRQIRPQPILLF